jgi:hypothetical protein
MLTSAAVAAEVHDIKVPDTLNCGGKVLPLQGSALRTATLFKIRVYVISYYAATKANATPDPEALARPVCFRVNYLRDIDDDDADKAWKYQFKESSEYPYPDLESHVKKLQESFGEIKGDRLHQFELVEGKTTLLENGVKKGEVDGTEFQKNFLSVWFGKKSPVPNLNK